MPAIVLPLLTTTQKNDAHMTHSPAGPRIVTLLDEVSIAELLQDVAQQVSQSSYLFLPHPGSPTAYAAAPHTAPAFVEVVTDFLLEPAQGCTVVTPVVSWRGDAGSGSHPASEMIVAEFRFAVSQVDPSAYELHDNDAEASGGWQRSAPTSPPRIAQPAPPAPPQPAPPVQQQLPPQPLPIAVSTAEPALAAAPVRQGSWTLSSRDGLRLTLLQHTVVGRRPAAQAATPTAQLLPLPDPGRKLSKTHALFETSGASAWVTDLGSTNGTRIATSQGTSACPAHQRIEISHGDRVLVGELELTVSYEA